MGDVIAFAKGQPGLCGMATAVAELDGIGKVDREKVKHLPSTQQGTALSERQLRRPKVVVGGPRKPGRLLTESTVNF